MRKYRSAKDLAKLTKRGRYAAGPNLYLQISEWGTRAWIFRYRIDGRHRHMGLGPADLLTLQEARDKAHAARRQLKIDGVDPIEVKRAGARAARTASERAKTFKECALEYIAQHEDMWRGDASRRQWVSSFEHHVFSKIGDMLIADVDVAAVLSVLDPIRDRLVTARRVRNRLGLILDWAISRDLRSDNPAKRPNLLPKRKPKVTHLPALPYPALPSFLPQLRQRPEMSARALELAILCAARPGEVLGARWSEIDLSEATWTIPGERMKSGRPHRVPLSGRAVELLADLFREGDFVFLGARTGAQPHPMVLIDLLRRMGHSVSAHGFRASFRTWAAERTNYAREVVEAALAHVVGDAAEQAYARGDMLARRRQLMETWAEYCSKPDTANGVVVPLRQGAPA
jgi:integrase